MTTLPKYFIGSYVKNGGSIKHKYDICTRQKKSGNCKILWDSPIQTDKTLEHNRQDITVIDKKNKKCILIDTACPFDTRIEKKEEEKCTNYSEMKYEIAKVWKMRKVEVIPVVMGVLGTVTKHFEKWIEKLDLDLTVEALQKPCLLGTGRIIRKCWI